MKKILLNNYRIKLTSILVAILLWTFVNSENRPKNSADIPVKIQYENLPESYRIISAPEVIKVHFQGDPESLKAIGRDEIKIVADLSAANEKTQRARIEIINNTRAKVISRISSVAIEIKRLKRMEKNISLNFTGSPPQGLALGRNMDYTPKKAFIYGDESELLSVSRVVANIDLTGQSKSFQSQAMLEVQNSSGLPIRGIVIKPWQIDVSIPIESGRSRTAAVVPVFVDDTDSNMYDVNVSPSTVSLIGNIEEISRVQKINTIPFDLSKCRTGGVFSVRLDIPDKIFANVEKVNLTCYPAKNAIKTVSAEIKMINICSGCSAVANPDIVEVRISGKSSVISDVSDQEINVVADLLELAPGSHKVKINAASTITEEDISLKPSVEAVDIIITGPNQQGGKGQ